MIDINDERLARLRIRIKSYGETLNGNESYDDLIFILKNSDIIKKEKEKRSNLIANDQKFKNDINNKNKLENYVKNNFLKDKEPIYLLSHK